MLLSPLPRRREGSPPPDAALCSFGLVLFGSICLDQASGQSPTLPHQPCIHIGAVGQLAYREHAPVAIGSSLVAGQITAANTASQFVRCDPPTWPGLPISIHAKLICLRRIDSFQPNVGARDDDGFAVDHPRFADDGGQRWRVPMFIPVETECADDNDGADEPLRLHAA